MKIKLSIWTPLILLLFYPTLLQSQEKANSQKFTTKVHNESKHFIGSSFFTIINVIPGIPFYFGQVDYGYHLTQKDILILEFLFWKYYSSMGDPDITNKAYPGSVLAYGPSFAYQRYLWKKLFTTMHLTPLITDYTDTQGRRIDIGFQPWFQFRTGYHFNIGLFNQHFYLEPSVEANYWPFNFNTPQSFKDIDKKYDKYLIAPGLNFGVQF